MQTPSSPVCNSPKHAVAPAIRCDSDCVEVIYVRDEEEEAQERERAATVVASEEGTGSEGEERPKKRSKTALSESERERLREELKNVKREGARKMRAAAKEARKLLEKMEEIEEDMKNKAYALNEHYVDEVPDVKLTFQEVEEEVLDREDNAEIMTLEDCKIYVKDMENEAHEWDGVL